MKIGVLVKTVNFVYAQTGTDLRSNYVGRDDIVQMLNPADEAALEQALQLKDRHPGTQVVAVACGDHAAETGLRHALAMGADRAIHLLCEDPGLDAWALSQLQGKACRREGFDLLLCGTHAIDVNDELQGQFVAARLGIPCATSIVRITAASDPRRLELQRLIERSDRQLLECSLPALLTIEKGGTTPRYPTLSGFLHAREAAIELLTVAELGETAASLTGQKRTEVVGVSRPRPMRSVLTSGQPLRPVAERISFMVNGDTSQARAGGRVIEADSAELFPRLDALLREAGVLKN